MFWGTAFTVIVLLTGAVAQTSNVTQCISQYQWAVNSLGQTPCLVAAQLESLCGPVEVDALPVGTHYLGPTFAAATPCICSTVTYSLISACAGCQNRTYTIWGNWSINCPYLENTTFPKVIPPAYVVPSWAYLDVTVSGIFDPVAAQANITHSLATPTTAQPSSSASSSVDHSPSNTVASTSSHSNAGAIAGGVVGGIVFLAALVLGTLWYLLRRRRHPVERRLVNLAEDEVHAAPPPMEGYNTDRTVTSPVTSDQSTYIHETSDVGSMVTSAMYTTFGGRLSSDSLPYSSQAPHGYSGAPEF